MNIYDTANNLAEEIKKSEEYSNYANLKKEISEDEEKKKKLDEFDALRYSMQIETMKGNKQNEDGIKDLQERYSKLITDKKMKDYFEAEMKFNVMIADINKIIAEAVKDVL